MAHWYLQCLWMCVIALTATAYRTSGTDCDDTDPHNIHQDHRPHARPISRIDNSPSNGEREPMNGRSTSDRTNERPGRYSANERSIPFTSNVQRIPEQERKHTRVLDFIPSVENGTFKILNNAQISLTSRRGLVEEDAPRQRDSVVFPRDAPRTNGFVPVPQNLPEDCMKIGICEDVLYYPEERVNSIINKLGNAKDKLKLDEQLPPELTQRIGPPEELELCNFTEKIMIPRAAADKNGKWYFIVNQNPYPLQGVRVEICKNDMQPCSNQAYFYSGYEGRCKQKYALRYMTALDEKGAPFEQSFKLPSCCSCVVKQVD